MTQILVAALMWVLVVSLLIVRRKRADRSITYASITIAVAMTLNVDAVYAAIDPVLGGTNIATLIADTLLMVGLFFLGRGVMHAGEYRPRLVRAAVSLPTLLVALAAIAVMFTPLAKICWCSLSFRNEVPRAMDGPAMAPISGLISDMATRFSKITGAVVESILRAPRR